jgi:uncharacterized protein YjlB
MTPTPGTDVAHTTWPGGGPPTRAEIETLFREQFLSPGWWFNGPGEVYAPHTHRYHKVLYCLRGEITFRVEPDGGEYRLEPGDRLEISPGTSHSAVVGPSGVECAEAAR